MSKSIQILESETAQLEAVRWLEKWGLEVHREESRTVFAIVLPDHTTSYAPVGDWVVYDWKAGTLVVLTNDEYYAKGLTNPHAGK